MNEAEDTETEKKKHPTLTNEMLSNWERVDHGTIHYVDMMGYRTVMWEDSCDFTFMFLSEYTTVYLILHWPSGEYKTSK